MKAHKEVLDIFKTGIRSFIEISVKQQHEHLLASLPDTTNLGFTRPESCFECSRDNLKPRHSEKECPSLNNCFCKNRRREKRACPNSTCDYIYEGIIEDHMKYSPNLKNTDISLWTQNYWDIAKCYMEHKSESAENTDLLDLLHLIANNRFILQRLLSKGTGESAEDQQKQLSEVLHVLDKAIKICRQIKRSTGLCSLDDLQDLRNFLLHIGDQNSSKAVEDLAQIAAGIDCTERKGTISLPDVRNAVKEYFKSAKSKLSCGPTDSTESYSKFVSLQLLFEQKLIIGETIQSFEVGQFVESSVSDILFGNTEHRTVFVESTENENQRTTNWSEKEWFIYNVLRNYYISHSKQGNEKNLNAASEKKYSEIIVVSKSVATRTNVPFKLFCEGILNILNRLPSRQKCLIILDLHDEVVEGVFKRGSKKLKRHTVVKLQKPGDTAHLEKSSKRQLLTIYVKTKPVTELTIRNVGEDLILKKEITGIIQQILYKSVKKIGEENISSITFERICFDDISTKIKLSNIPQLMSLKLRECAFTPVNCNCVSIEILSGGTMLSNHLNQVKMIMYTAIQTCLGLQYVETSEVKIGRKTTRIKLSSKAIARCADEHFGVNLRTYDKDDLDLLEIETAKVLMDVDFDSDDVKLVKGKEKAIILHSIKFDLLKSDSNLVHVYPAENHLKSKNIVYACFMKENFDIDNECVYGQYRGFDTFRRSYNEVSAESLLAESSVLKLEGTDKLLTEQIKKDIEETVAFHSRELMAKHSNLEVVGVSLGKAKKNSLDISTGPCIVLYVRLKSFIPYSENLFPTELTHPYKPSVQFNTDVREGYFIPLADNNFRQFYPEMKVPYLVMGCSIGFPGNDFAATVGPFVEIESGNSETKTKETGFLTVCHLFSLPENAHSVIGTQVVQPSDGDEPVVDLSAGRRELGISHDKVCGEVVACIYNQDVDAALVKITRRHPPDGTFITCQRRDLKAAGFTGTVKYKDGLISNLEEAFRQNVVKFGKTTSLSLGQCCLKGMAIRTSKDDITATNPLMPEEKRSITMYNLFFVGGFGDKSFSDNGDSGSGVFLVNRNNSIACIGMIVGKTTDNYCIAIPIQRILDELSRTNHTRLENLKITMKRFDD